MPHSVRPAPAVIGGTLCLAIAIDFSGSAAGEVGDDGRRRVKLLEFRDYEDIADLAEVLFPDAVSPAENQRQSPPEGGRTE
jgi:hypothetical protein